jgi:pyruvate formate lyase activating enzyme
MKFCGLQKTSLVDFPNRIASVLFAPGCNLRCPYCYNWRIVLDPKPPFLNEETALQILKGRRKYVDSIVITGGEPTTHKELPRFLAKLKDDGFLVKLDTNGFCPQVLEECLASVDYVALDIKAAPEKYWRLGAKDTGDFLRTVEILKSGKVDYEFRTTVVPGIVDAQDIMRICEIVKGAKTLALQQFVPNDTLDKSFSVVKPHSPEQIIQYAKTMEKYASHVVLRI